MITIRIRRLLNIDTCENAKRNIHMYSYSQVGVVCEELNTYFFLWKCENFPLTTDTQLNVNSLIYM